MIEVVIENVSVYTSLQLHELSAPRVSVYYSYWMLLIDDYTWEYLYRTRRNIWVFFNYSTIRFARIRSIYKRRPYNGPVTSSWGRSSHIPYHETSICRETSIFRKRATLPGYLATPSPALLKPDRKEHLKAHAQQNLSDKAVMITKAYQYYQSFPRDKQNIKWWHRMRKRASVWESWVTKLGAPGSPFLFPDLQPPPPPT